MIFTSGTLKYSILTISAASKTPRPSGRKLQPPPKIEKPEAKQHGRPAIQNGKTSAPSPLWMMVAGIGD